VIAYIRRGVVQVDDAEANSVRDTGFTESSTAYC
jgi:hypothetical protein